MIRGICILQMITPKQIMDKRLPEISNKGIITDSLRMISWPFTMLFYYFRFTANMVTILGIFFILVPVYFISLGNRTNSIIGSLLFIVWFIFDLCDGEVARCRNEISEKGLYLDILYHDISMPILFFSIGINAYKYYNNIIMIYLGFFIVMCCFIINIVWLDKFKLPNYDCVKQSFTIIKTKKSKIEQIINFFNHPQKMMLYFCGLSLFGLLHLALFFYVVFYGIICFMKCIKEYRSF